MLPPRLSWLFLSGLPPPFWPRCGLRLRPMAAKKDRRNLILVVVVREFLSREVAGERSSYIGKTAAELHRLGLLLEMIGIDICR